MKTIVVIISVVVIPVTFMATIIKELPLKVECKVESQKVECKVEGQRPVLVRKEYLDMN